MMTKTFAFPCTSSWHIKKFCSLCQRVVIGLPTRRDFHKTTKYRNCLLALSWTCDHSKLLPLHNGCGIFFRCHDNQLDEVKNLVPSIYFGKYSYCPKIGQTIWLFFVDFQNFHFLTKVKITSAIDQKFV